MGNIVVIATLDTRGDEVRFLKELIEGRGHTAVAVDAGVMGEPLFPGDITREAVAEAGGRKLAELIGAAHKGADRYEATRIMAEGVKKTVAELHSSGKIDGIMSLGGSTGAMLGAAAMKALPLGMPKLIVTTFASLAPIGHADITVMQAPVDLVGLNEIVRRVLGNAAGAVAGMIEQELPQTMRRKIVGITALGVTTPAVQHVISRLEKLGFDSLVFHAKTAELDQLIHNGGVDAVIDLTSFETVPMTLYSDEMVALLAGAPEVRRTRLESAGENKLPQIIAPGGLDMHILPGAGKDSIPAEYEGRAWTMHGEYIVLFRTSCNELERIATSIAERANKAKGPVAILIPLRGFSEASREGAPLHDPQADRAFIDALRTKVAGRIGFREIDCHINDAQFADEVVKTFSGIMSGKG